MSNYGSQSVSVIDKSLIGKEYPVVKTFTFQGGPEGIAVTSDGAKLYVCLYSAAPNTTVASVNTTSGKITPITTGQGPSNVAISPDGSKAYVTNDTGNTVSIISTATDQVIDTISPVNGAFDRPGAVAVSPDGKTLYVANFHGGTLSIIDLVTKSIQNVVVGNGYGVAGGQPDGVAVSPDGSTVYVSNYGDGSYNTSLAVVKSGVVTNRIDFGYKSPIIGVGFTPDGSKAYIAHSAANNVSVINTGDLSTAAVIPVGQWPMVYGIFIEPRVFSGAPKTSTCYGQTMSLLSQQFSRNGGLNGAAKALGYSNVKALQAVVTDYCGVSADHRGLPAACCLAEADAVKARSNLSQMAERFNRRPRLPASLPHPLASALASLRLSRRRRRREQASPIRGAGGQGEAIVETPRPSQSRSRKHALDLHSLPF